MKLRNTHVAQVEGCVHGMLRQHRRNRKFIAQGDRPPCGAFCKVCAKVELWKHCSASEIARSYTKSAVLSDL